VLVIPTFPLIIVIVGYLRAPVSWLMVFVLVSPVGPTGQATPRPGAVAAKSRLPARGQGPGRIELVRHHGRVDTADDVAHRGQFPRRRALRRARVAGLQFVGLGNLNAESWGTMLYWAQNNEALQTGLPLWALAPGVAIAILGSGLALLNYAFDEVANPALRPYEP